MSICVILGGLRLLFHEYFLVEWLETVVHILFTKHTNSVLRVAIYGAGSAANQLVTALRMGKNLCV